MIATVVLSSALATAGGRPPRKRAGSEPPKTVAAGYVPTGTGVDPSLLPPLVGRTQQLEIDGTKRTSIRFGVSHDGAVLAGLDQAASQVLRRQLAADPTWRVTRLRGTWVATRRVPSDDTWTTGFDGYHLGTGCWRVGVRLGPAADGYPWAGGAGISVLTDNERDNGVWAIGIEQPPCRGQRAIAVVAVGADVAIEVLDSGAGDRVHQALSELPIDLANAAIDSDLVATRGFDPDQLAAPLPDAPTPPTLTVHPDGLEFTAAVHFQAPFLCWARVVRDGVAWEEPTLAEATFEAPGWSSTTTDLFFLQSRVPLTVETPFEALTELWCRPETGDPIRVASSQGWIGGKPR